MAATCTSPSPPPANSISYPCRMRAGSVGNRNRILANITEIREIQGVGPSVERTPFASAPFRRADPPCVGTRMMGSETAPELQLIALGYGQRSKTWRSTRRSEYVFLPTAVMVIDYWFVQSKAAGCPIR
jgi:hypothetical protein